jgi:hypothetical protein
MVLKLGCFGQKIRNTWEVLKCGARVGWKRSVGLIMWELKYCLESRNRGPNWIGHILRRSCFLQRVIEGKIKGGIEVTGRQGRRRKKLLDNLKKRRGYSHLKKQTLDRTMWRARFGPVVRQTTKWMNEWMNSLSKKVFVNWNISLSLPP